MRTSIGRESRPVTKSRTAQIDASRKSLIDRSPDELSGIAGSNPDAGPRMVAELRQRREGLEAEVRALDTALHSLLGVRGRRSRTAA